nr:PREDICTED: uncharacterized protein LOC109033162 [Bemisia tabaci]
MVLALEYSQTKITSDLIKSKLLDHADKKVEENAQAFLTGKRPYKTIKCNYRGLLGHRTVNCRKKPKGNGESNTSTNNASASSSSHSNGKDSDIKTNQQHGKKKPKHSFFTALASFNFSCNEWFLDSGASKQHMTCYREILTEFQTLPPECITTASNTVIKSQGQGVRHLTTVDYTPQQNGVAERVNRTLLEKARCMLFDANLPKSYWAEAVNHAAFLKNRSPSRAIPDHTPEEMWSAHLQMILKHSVNKMMSHLQANRHHNLQKNLKQRINQLQMNQKYKLNKLQIWQKIQTK